MSWTAVVAIAVGLAMDAFAVSVAGSAMLPRITVRHYFRFAFHFGLFQALMPVLGWLAGTTIARWVSAWDHWIAFGLLVFVGGRAIYEGVSGDGSVGDSGRDPTRGWSLVVLSVATSIDAFAVGLSLACLRVSIWGPVVAIGLITGALSLVGMFLGRRLGRRFGERAAILGGLVLIGIGIKILVEHLGG